MALFTMKFVRRRTRRLQHGKELGPPKPLEKRRRGRPGIAKHRKLQKKKQVMSVPSTRMKEMIEEIMEAISDFMNEGQQWVSQEEVLEYLKAKGGFDELENAEVTSALSCGLAFGLLMKTLDHYSLPKRVFQLMEEGKMPDWDELNEDWRKRPRRVHLQKRVCWCA